MIIILYLAIWTFIFLILSIIALYMDRKSNAIQIIPLNQHVTLPKVEIQTPNYNTITQLRHHHQQYTTTLQRNSYQYDSNDPDVENFFGMKQPQDEIVEIPLDSTGRNQPSDKKIILRENRVEIDLPPQMNRNNHKSKTHLRKNSDHKQTVAFNGQIVQTFKLDQHKRTRHSTQVALQHHHNHDHAILDTNPRSPQQQIIASKLVNNNENIKKTSELQQEQNDSCKKYYKYNQILKIMSKDKQNIRRLELLFVIYFRQIICLDLMCIIINYDLQLLSEYLALGLSAIIVLFFRLIDSNLRKQLKQNLFIKPIYCYYIILWIIAVCVIILVIIFEYIQEESLMIYNSVAIVSDIFLIDLIKIFLYKNCLPDKKITIDENPKIDEQQDPIAIA